MYFSVIVCVLLGLYTMYTVFVNDAECIDINVCMA